jgi:O-methyltransferase
MHFATRVIKSAFRRAGFEISRAKDTTGNEPLPPDFDAATQDLCRYVRPFTMTSAERIFALRQAVMHVVEHGIPGDIVECGVWKGGSMMAVARTLKELRATERNLHLFDTFDGMPTPGEEDVNLSDESAAALMSQSDKESGVVWAYGALEEVKRNLLSTGYPAERISFVKGKVEETIPMNAPAQIALLRLDTDWYESTYHELVHLYPRLSPGGVLIIDDYGHWKGARRAVDAYISEQKLRLLLNRIDYTGRICVKNQAVS